MKHQNEGLNIDVIQFFKIALMGSYADGGKKVYQFGMIEYKDKKIIMAENYLQESSNQKFKTERMIKIQKDIV